MWNFMYRTFYTMKWKIRLVKIITLGFNFSTTQDIFA